MMRIAVQVIVEMTPAQITDYCAVNGVERGEVRQDVRNYIRSALQDSPAFTMGAADITVKG